MVSAVKPKHVGRGAMLLIGAAAIVAAIGLIRGQWIVVAAMALIILGQAPAFRWRRR